VALFSPARAGVFNEAPYFSNFLAFSTAPRQPKGYKDSKARSSPCGTERSFIPPWHWTPCQPPLALTIILTPRGTEINYFPPPVALNALSTPRGTDDHFKPTWHWN